MTTAEARQLVQKTFQNPFDKGQFVYFIKNLVNEVDEEKAFHARGYVHEKYRERVKTYERIGTYTDPEDNKIDILIVYLQKENSIDRARTTLRNFVGDYLKKRGEKEAGLIAFVSPNQKDWRFSLVKMEYKITETPSGRIKAKEEFTPAKRYSFLVGVEETSHTAQSRLVPILEDDANNPTLKQLEEAFNIEKVTKEFFEKYRDLYLWVKETLDEVLARDKAIKADFAKKNIDTIDFGKKLLGQIVFLYFLQKKGWFGVKRGEAWGSGSKNFLRELFDKKHGDYKNFFNDILEPLFYEALRNDRSHDDHYFSMFKCKIPFLNGGLFDPINNYDWNETDIILPNELFSNQLLTREKDKGAGILDIFDRYNFTVKEDEPLEKEVAVDPEMLGKVFENLLEVKDRKSKGTYYTPREIVHYMCQESLVNYLATELEGEMGKKDIETLIKYGEGVIEHDAVSVKKKTKDPKYKSSYYKPKLPKSIEKHAKLIDEKLETIRICDPAVGSGAFPVGMMNEIIRTRNALTSYLKSKKGRTIYDFKRHAIQNCLYGVDMDLGAVEIAKLRLWLSLIVDEEDIKQIKPLPNLDYKIVQGNSLVELLSGEFLASSTNQKRYELVNKLKKDKDELFDITSPSQKEQKRQGIDELVKEIFEYDRNLIIDDLRQDIKGIQNQGRLFKDTKLETGDRERIEELDGKIKEIQKIEIPGPAEHFEWHINFSEVFQEKKGFDVVIANPPYLEARSPEFSEKMKDEAQRGSKNRWGADSEYITRGADLLIYFLEIGTYLIGRKGTVVFITQNSWLDTDYGKKFQNFLINHTNVKAIIDSDFKYFDSRLGPNINTVISVFVGKEVNPNNAIVFARYHENFEKIGHSLDDVKSSSPEIEIKRFKYENPVLNTLKWGTLLSSSEAELYIFTLIEKNGERLSQLVDYNLSIGQGLNVAKSLVIEKEVAEKFSFLSNALIPFMRSEDGAPFVLEETKGFIVDGSRLEREEIKKLKSAGVGIFDPTSTGKIAPILIMPRGVSRHYCALNLISAYSSSGVDIYDNKGNLPEEMKLNLWLFLNSSVAWLLREITGRKSLGGGLLKVEATDLRDMPIYFNFSKAGEVKKILKKLQKRQALPTIEEIKTTEHKELDKIVFDFLAMSQKQRDGLVNLLRKHIEGRATKSRT